MALELVTAGESHGPALVAIVTGLPAGLTLDRESIDADLHRRRCSPACVTDARSGRRLRSSSAIAITTTGRGA